MITLLGKVLLSGVTVTLPVEAKVRGTEIELGEVAQVAGLDAELVERLRAEGANLFRETASSGAPTEQTPGDAGAGFLRQAFLERSNVSVVDELIALIQAQRNYEVNSRTIQVSDEMLQQVSNLIR